MTHSVILVASFMSSTIPVGELARQVWFDVKRAKLMKQFADDNARAARLDREYKELLRKNQHLLPKKK